MSEFKGTKGKWSIFSDQFNNQIIANENGFIAETKTKANALLISKAPEMLEMLQDLEIAMRAVKVDLVADKISKIIKEATEL